MITALAGGPLDAAEEPLPRLPQEASGEIHFWADGTVLQSASGSPLVFVSLAVSQEELRCVEPESTGGQWADLDVLLGAVDASGQTFLTQGSRLAVPCVEAAGDSISTQRLLYLEAPLKPGTSAIEITLTDRNAARIGLVPVMRGEKRHGTALGVLEAGGLRAGRGLSGILFVSTVPRRDWLRAESGYGLAPADSLRPALEPNPSRGYGLRNPTLKAYVEAYGLAGGEGELTLRLFDDADRERPVSEHSASLILPWARCGIVAMADVSALPSGAYDLEIAYEPWGETIEPFRTAGRFQVMWNPASWSQTQSRIAEESSALLPEEELARFLTLEPGEREAYLDSIWYALGDAPRQGVGGPQQAQFRERVAIANNRYGWSAKRGATTDRGRVFIRFGEPDDVRKELTPQWKEQIYYYLQGEVSEGQSGESGAGVVLPHWLDDAAYEIWSYVGAGDPLVPAWSPPSRGASLEFVFMDRLGTGDYRLVYTNLVGGF